MNLLISGIGGDIGLGAGRILKEWHWPGAIHGIDIHKEHAGPFVCDHCAVAPRAEAPHYVDWVADYVRNNDISVFVPTSEAEIARLTSDGLKVIESAKILKAGRLVVEKSLDKLECLHYLGKNGIVVPKHGLVGTDDPETYPIIVKPRSGQGSKSIFKIKSQANYCPSAFIGSIWQDYLDPDDEEYTCAIYKTPTLGTRILILKRKLQGGMTSVGTVVENYDIENYVSAIASKLELDGLINIQLRLTKDGPLIFEINPRLSSTLVFRDKLGFRDFRWWLSELVGIETETFVPPKPGTMFFRGSCEYISEFLPTNEKV